ncbi:hypothetical protein [Leptospira sp. B5-022]|uniref:hypothetical protein n=1 Tax=Leptospira sp. B5-022 TaxID=1242992 RepID=UPI000560D661|nr:hypothetical protein [Leptospira sp. B5-022]
MMDYEKSVSVFLLMIFQLNCGVFAPEGDTTDCAIAALNKFNSTASPGSDADLLNTVLVSAACKPE